ncbi:MAG: DUF4129 domain-containing protein [Acidimicrobiales bacterium]|nr:DUF4129 domain-containing protein [Acidimicrobiales bacterium]
MVGAVVNAALVGRATGVAGAPADLPPPDHDPGEARRAADDILARPEYQWSDDRSVLDRVGQWVAEQIERVLEPFGLAAGGLPGWVGWLVLVALALLVGLLVYKARHGWRRNPAPETTPGGRVVVSAGDEGTDWAAEVARCEQAGLWRDAVRARYRVLAADLARRQAIGDLVGRTAGELVAEVRQTSPAAAPSFGRATDLFEQAWYGGADVGPADRDRFADLADAALRAVDSDRARPEVPA